MRHASMLLLVLVDGLMLQLAAPIALKILKAAAVPGRAAAAAAATACMLASPLLLPAFGWLGPAVQGLAVLCKPADSNSQWHVGVCWCSAPVAAAVAVELALCSRMLPGLCGLVT
jgi:hypothetical protein